MIAMRMLPERKCYGCTRQADWGCHAYEYRDPETGEKRWANKAKLPLTIDGEETWACPRQPLKEQPRWWDTVITYHQLYKKGFLPDEGSVSGQSSRALTIFGIIDDVLNECDREEIDKDKRKRAAQEAAQKTAGRR